MPICRLVVFGLSLSLTATPWLSYIQNPRLLDPTQSSKYASARDNKATCRHSVTVCWRHAWHSSFHLSAELTMATCQPTSNMNGQCRQGRIGHLCRPTSQQRASKCSPPSARGFDKIISPSPPSSPPVAVALPWQQTRHVPLPRPAPVTHNSSSALCFRRWCGDGSWCVHITMCGRLRV